MARTAFKKAKAAAKPVIQKEPSPHIPATEVVQSTGAEADLSSSDEEDSDDDNEGVDEEGMVKLMSMLGEDGLDEVAEQQLSELGLDEATSDEEDEEDEDGSSDEGDAIVGDGEGDSDSGWVDGDKEMDVSGDSGVEAAVNEESEEEDDDAVPLDEISDVDEDAVPKQKVVINNEVSISLLAFIRCADRVLQIARLEENTRNNRVGQDMPWTETLAFTTSEPLDIPNADDDLNRELAIYKQALSTANTARTKFLAAKLPFSRPSDYFAEMVKSDSHMERIRQRLLDERAGIQKSEVAKKQRELKKVGKQVQVEKLKEREKSKKEMNERVKGLKRSESLMLLDPSKSLTIASERGGALDNQDSEAFDVAVEEAISDRPAKRGKPNMSRAKRDAKFGFGGAGTKGRRGKQNTKESSENFEFRKGMGREASKGGRGGRGGRGGQGGRGGHGGSRGGSKRPGKSRRNAGRA
ncbi:rRNA-processing protein ebp2 [Ceratobasidium sp. AG-Ba]|nr:rRNA-processing protein ebp2 [Ceratobasidium sp. AG-Ba]